MSETTSWAKPTWRESNGPRRVMLVVAWTLLIVSVAVWPWQVRPAPYGGWTFTVVATTISFVFNIAVTIWFTRRGSLASAWTLVVLWGLGCLSVVTSIGSTTGWTKWHIAFNTVLEGIGLAAGVLLIRGEKRPTR